MPSNPIQISQIVDKLLLNLKSGMRRWDSGVTANSYQIRYGDFLITLSGDGFVQLNSLSINQKPVRLEIKKLDGKTVANIETQTFAASSISSISSTISSFSNQIDTADHELSSKIVALYNTLAARSDDLDDLLKLL